MRHQALPVEPVRVGRDDAERDRDARVSTGTDLDDHLLDGGAELLGNAPRLLLAGPGRATMNSSPPYRATTSDARSDGPHDPAERPQRLVAGRMSVRVVELLEMVDVHHDQAERLANPARRRPAAARGTCRRSARCGARSARRSWPALRGSSSAACSPARWRPVRPRGSRRRRHRRRCLSSGMDRWMTPMTWPRAIIGTHAAAPLVVGWAGTADRELVLDVGHEVRGRRGGCPDSDRSGRSARAARARRRLAPGAA